MKDWAAQQGATYTIWAEDGEYQQVGGTIAEALAAWQAAHPNLAVAAIVDDAMQPALVLAEEV